MEHKIKYQGMFCIIFSLLLCMGLVSCSQEPATKPLFSQDGTYRVKGEDYSLVKREGSTYLVFDNPALYEETEETSSDRQNVSVLAGIQFSSVKEFKETVVEGKMSAAFKREVIKKFGTNKQGEIPVCDLEHMYVPVFPSGGEYQGLRWYGERYSYSVQLEGGIRATYQIFSPEKYERQYQADEEYIFRNDRVKITSQEEIDGKTVVHYSADSAEDKLVYFTVSVGEKSLKIRKIYWLASTNPYMENKSSPTVPTSITIYYQDENGQSIISISELTEDPTDEWLMQFGMREYQESADAGKKQ